MNFVRLSDAKSKKIGLYFVSNLHAEEALLSSRFWQRCTRRVFYC